MNVHPARARSRMARISLFGIAAVLMLTGITVWSAQVILRLKPESYPLRSTRSRSWRTQRICLEPISKSFEEDNEAGELDKAEEVRRMILPADENAALPLDPGKEALD